jgi:hypothetical protein
MREKVENSGHGRQVRVELKGHVQCLSSNTKRTMRGSGKSGVSLRGTGKASESESEVGSEEGRS